MTNAKFYRNLVCAGLGALALGYVPLSHAFYAQATPPAGFVAGAINTFNGARAGVTASVALGRIAANASLNVGGRAVGIATKIPLAANAARVAALALYAHPVTRTGLQVAAWLGAGKLLYDASQGWVTPDADAEVSDGLEYSTPYSPQWVASKSTACSTGAAAFVGSRGSLTSASVIDGQCVFSWKSNDGTVYTDSYLNLRSRGGTCPSGWYITGAGCVQSQPSRPVTADQFAEQLTRQPMPPNILPELPFDLPVDVPYIEPIFVPTGNPVKNPKYDPSKPQTGENQPYVQPGVKIDPANDAKNPFQVNVQPSDRPTASPNGSTDPQPITPPGTEGDGSTDQPKEDKDERDLCEKNPDILACQKVDTEVEDAEIPKAQKTVNYQPESIWGGGSCPADKYARVGGQQVKVVDWSRDCQFVTDYVKPVTLVICALIVAGILAGALKS